MSGLPSVANFLHLQGMNTVAIDKTSKQLAKSLGKNVARILGDRGITRTELAEKAGLHRQFVWEVIQGNHVVNFADVKKIADVLGMTFEELIAANPKQPA